MMIETNVNLKHKKWSDCVKLLNELTTIYNDHVKLSDLLVAEKSEKYDYALVAEHIRKQEDIDEDFIRYFNDALTDYVKDVNKETEETE